MTEETIKETATEPCDCATLRAKVEELLHNELCAAEAKRLNDHIANCPDCKDEADVLNRLTVAVKRACGESAPGELRDLIVNKIRNFHSD